MRYGGRSAAEPGVDQERCINTVPSRRRGSRLSATHVREALEVRQNERAVLIVQSPILNEFSEDLQKWPVLGRDRSELLVLVEESLGEPPRDGHARPNACVPSDGVNNGREKNLPGSLKAGKKEL